MSFIIYGIYDPTNNNIKYVGKTTTNLKIRLNNHLYRARSGRSKSLLSIWLLGLTSKNLRPFIQPLEIIQDNNANWKHYEIKWIKHFENCDILNVTPGGNGSHIRKIIDDGIISMFGQISDAEIAKKVGLTREAITYHRNKLGIKPLPVKKRKFNPHNKGKPAYNRKQFSEETTKLMGKIPDYKLAKIAGVGRKTIEKFRKRNGINCYIPVGESHQMAKLNKENVSNIRNEYKNNKSINDLSKLYNVSYDCIYDIVKWRSWKND